MPDKHDSEVPQFRGFQGPNFTPVPDELFDELMVDLTGAELRVLLYIIRRTFGFKKDSDNISLSQMLHGIVTRDGRILDRGAGISKSSLLAVLRSLKARNIIFTERNNSAERGNEPTNYKLNIVNSPIRTKNAPPLGAKLDQGGGRRIRPTPWPENPATQETVEQETAEQETDRSKSRTASSLEETEDRSVFTEAIGDSTGDPQAIGALIKRKNWPIAQPYDNDRQTILNYVEDFARELGDQASLKTSTSRAYNLFERSGVSLEEFIGRMYEARSITKEASARITKKADGRKIKIAYWFSVLEQRLGLQGAGGYSEDSSSTAPRTHKVPDEPDSI